MCGCHLWLTTTISKNRKKATGRGKNDKPSVSAAIPVWKAVAEKLVCLVHLCIIRSCGLCLAGRYLAVPTDYGCFGIFRSSFWPDLSTGSGALTTGYFIQELQVYIEARPIQRTCATNSARKTFFSATNSARITLFFARVSLTGFFEINLRLFAASWQNCTS